MLEKNMFLSLSFVRFIGGIVMLHIMILQWHVNTVIIAVAADSDHSTDAFTPTTTSKKTVVTTAKTALVQLDKISYYPGQIMKITVTRTDKFISHENVRIVIAPANVTDLTIEWGDELNVFYSRTWTSKTIATMVFNIRFVEYIPGLYQVGFLSSNGTCCEWTLLGKANTTILINKPVLSINLPKKEFYQGEAVVFNIYDPYINLTYKSSDASPSPPGYSAHRFKIVPTYTSVYEKTIPMIDSQISKKTIVPYDVDEYKIILERYHTESSGIIGSYERSTYVGDVTNSTFTVKRNYPILSVQSKPTINCSIDLLQVSLTTMNKIPLIGPYKIDIVSTRNELNVKKSISMINTDTLFPQGTVVLNTSYFSFRSAYFEPYRVRIVLDDIKLWARSSYFYAGCD
jgi:hypothetical protein